MARYRGPKAKIARRFREAIFGPSKALEKKIILQGCTVTLDVVERNRSMRFN